MIPYTCSWTFEEIYLLASFAVLNRMEWIESVLYLLACLIILNQPKVLYSSQLHVSTEGTYPVPGSVENAYQRNARSALHLSSQSASTDLEHPRPFRSPLVAICGFTRRWPYLPLR
jgi:hypothetical protein